MARKQFTFYAGFMDGISRIRNKSARCDAYDSIVKYALEGIEPDLSSLPDAAAIAFVMAKPNIDASRRRADNAKRSNDDRTNIETVSNEHRNETKPKQEKEQEQVKMELVYKKIGEKDKEQLLKYSDAVAAWNALGLSQITKISAASPRGKMLKARITEHGEDGFFKAIDNIRHSSFLRGQNDRGWTVTFDWFVKPSNFVKVLEGNYADKTPAKVETRKGVPYGGKLNPDVVRKAYLSACEEFGEDPESVTA